jgi:hypothetical protein
MRNQPTTEKAKAFMAHNPTFLGRVHGVDLYEHPAHGDESTLVAITADGRKKATGHWEVPSPDDGEDLRSL